MNKISWYNSIKLKLIVILIIISIIPLLLLGFYNMKVIKLETKESINKQHVLTASRVSLAVSDIVKTLQSSLETISLTNSEVFYLSSKSQKENLLYGVLKSFPHLEEVSIVSSDGKDIVKVSKRYAICEDDLSLEYDNLYFQKLKERESFIGSPNIGEDNQIIFDIGVPIGGMNEEFLGGIIAQISLRQVMQEISSIELANGSYVMLVDGEGELIGHSDYSQVLRRQDVSYSQGVKNIIKNNMNDKNNIKALEFTPIRYNSYTGEDVLGVYGLIPEVGWGVVVEQPVGDAYSNLSDMLFRLSLFLFIILVAIIVLGTFFVLQFIKPVEELAKGVSEAKEGNLDYQIPKHFKDELGLVIEAFNEMTKEIKKNRDNEKIAIQAEKNAAVGLLAAGIAHEINNPINNLGFYAYDLLDRMETEDVNDLKDEGVFEEYLLIIKEQINRCTNIIQSLLNFSREVEPQIKQVYIPDIINEVLKLTKYPIKKQNIEIDLDYGEAIPYIFTDQSKLQQVMLNLVTNSVYAMPKGGKLTIKLIFKNSMVGIEVIDTGEGILEEDFKHIFDPFYTTKPLGEGTGLGLATSKAIIEKMGGTISLENNEGVGAKAKICLPIKNEVE